VVVPDHPLSIVASHHDRFLKVVADDVVSDLDAAGTVGLNRGSDGAFPRDARRSRNAIADDPSGRELELDLPSTAGVGRLRDRRPSMRMFRADTARIAQGGRAPGSRRGSTTNACGSMARTLRPLLASPLMVTGA
jgi:hypothetical protein